MAKILNTKELEGIATLDKKLKMMKLSMKPQIKLIKKMKDQV